MENLSSQYYDLKDQEYKIANKAKHYIIDNWNKIINWEECSIGLTSLNHEFFWYRNHKLPYSFKDSTLNPIKTIDFVLDDIDGDLSVKINDKLFLDISNEEVIHFYEFIFSNLNKNG